MTSHLRFLVALKAVALLSLAAAFCAAAQPVAAPGIRAESFKSVSEYLPFGDSVTYDPSLKTPADFLGCDLDDRIPEWSDVVRYMEYLAAHSDRVSLQTFGASFERRPFIMATVTSPANQARLETIRREHLARLSPDRPLGPDAADAPVIVNWAASVHGNEISGCLAVLLLAYHYAASRDAQTMSTLEHSVLVINPGLNPDGINRYAQWVNTQAGIHRHADLQQRESSEIAPNARTNHYWMDCNRDWLTAQYPEGQNAVRMYEYWMPHVVLDIHEMSNPRILFYFSPGDPGRTYSYIPQENQDLTLAISRHTEKAMQHLGVPYFTRRGYDDYFIGKGACYGDIQGSVCILHEATTTRGHVRSEKVRSWRVGECVRWQAFAAQAVLDGALELRDSLIRYQHGFYVRAAERAASDPACGYVFDARGDRARCWHFIENLRLHEIDVYRVPGAGERYYVPFSQRHYYKIKGIFEDITQFRDSVFYDISSWTPARAYGLRFSLQRAPEPAGLAKVEDHPFPQGRLVEKRGDALPEAFAFSCGDYYAPWVTAELQRRGVQVDVVTEAFSYERPLPVAGRPRKVRSDFPAGTLLVRVQGQPLAEAELVTLLEQTAARSAVDFTALYPGKGSRGFRLESLRCSRVRSPYTALISTGGRPVQGAMWHLLDFRYGMKYSLVETETFLRPKSDWTRYDVMVLSHSAPSAGKAFYTRLREWVGRGGTLILIGPAAKAGASMGLPAPKLRPGKGVKGIALHAEMKSEGPLFWGYADRDIDLYKSNATVWQETPGLEVPLSWSRDPYRSGYISPANLKRVAGTPAAAFVREGKGVVVYFQEDLNFRSYWYGSNHLLTNAIFFGNLL